MPFPIEEQQQDLWCWAALADSVDHYFDSKSNLNQCGLARRVLGAPTDCCQNPGSCNQSQKLQDVLTKLGRLDRVLVTSLDCVGTRFASRDDFAGIKSEIDNRRPVCVRIQWFEGDKAHFVAICGYTELSSGVRTIDVADPFYGSTDGGTYFGIWTIDFDQFPAAYQGGGEWTATFLVQAKPGEILP